MAQASNEHQAAYRAAANATKAILAGFHPYIERLYQDGGLDGGGGFAGGGGRGETTDEGCPPSCAKDEYTCTNPGGIDEFCEHRRWYCENGQCLHEDDSLPGDACCAQTCDPATMILV